MQLKNKYILLWIAVLASLFYYSCKTSETVQNKGGENPTQQDLLQSTVDTNFSTALTPDEIQRITSMAQEAAKLYCQLKQFEGKDMNDINVAKAYAHLEQEYRIIQVKVEKLDAGGRMEYDRVFEESIKKCE